MILKRNIARLRPLFSHPFEVFASPLIADPTMCDDTILKNYRDFYNFIGDIKINQLYGTLWPINHGKEIKLKANSILQAGLGFKDPDRIIERSLIDAKSLNILGFILS